MLNFFKVALLSGLLLVSSAAAQNNQAPAPAQPSINNGSSQWFGVTSGFINSSYPVGLAFHYGVHDPQTLDLRFSVSYQFRNGGSALGLGGDALSIFAQSLPLAFYGGAGAAVFIENQSFLLDAHGLIGAEYRFSEYDLEEIGVFLEARIGAAVAVGSNIPQPSVPTVGLVIGLNVHF